MVAWTATGQQPVRIQLRRSKGWRLHQASTNPNGVVIVDRRSPWGNPFHADLYGAERAVELFRSVMADLKRDNPKRYRYLLAPLRGKDLACWCAEDASCHADTLLALVQELE